MLNRFLGLIIGIVLCVSCAKEENYVPNVPVNFSAPITDPRLNRLSAAGGAVTLLGGVAGIIVYRRADNAYVAFDRCSTVNPEQKNAVDLDNPTLTATDPVSGAKYLLHDGSPAKAPAKTALKRYTVTITSSTLQVTN
jgi:nitrite reductase/ring-hydroxylating ferredoxin subunit